MNCALIALTSFVIGIVLGALFNWLMNFSSLKEREHYLNIRRPTDDEHTYDTEERR